MFEDVSEPLHVIVNYGQKVRVSVFCHKIDCFGICLRFLISQNIKILLIKKLEKFSITKNGFLHKHLFSALLLPFEKVKSHNN